MTTEVSEDEDHTAAAVNSVDKTDVQTALAKILPIIARDAAARERDRSLPHEAFDLVRESGLLALRVPAARGGGGGSVAALLQSIAALAAADPNVAHALRSHFNFVETVLLSGHSVLDRYLPDILAGRIFGGAHTEKGTSRPGEIGTRLTLSECGYRLNGRKYYATGALYADRLFISALGPDNHPAIVEVDPKQQGVSLEDDWDGMGQRLTASGSIFLNDVAVSASNVQWRDTVEAQDRAGRHAATFRQLFLAACQVGIVRNVLADAIDYARSKARPITHSDASIAVDDHFVQRTVGLIASRSFALDSLLASAAECIDNAIAAILKADPHAEILLTKSAIATAEAQVVISDLALASANGIFDTGGGSATGWTLNFDRHWRNVRTIMSHNPLDHKLKAIGAFLLKGDPPPLNGGFF